MDTEYTNTILISLLNKWSNDICVENYEAVRHELLHGNSFLILPFENKHNSLKEWHTTNQPAKLKLKSIIEKDGMKVLGAFTDEQSLLAWMKKPTTYTAMKSQGVLQVCELNGIKRLVINSGSPNMFYLEYHIG